jgi:hypothetical protein
MRSVTLAAASLALALTAAHGQQPRWKSVGVTASRSAVSVDARSVKRTGPLVAATMRVLFDKPVQMREGVAVGSRSIATFDCARQTYAVKENAFLADPRGVRVTSRTVNRIPGYSVAIGGSPGAMTMAYLCTR